MECTFAKFHLSSTYLSLSAGPDSLWVHDTLLIALEVEPVRAQSQLYKAETENHCDY
jgi:hypothetical protein